MPARLGVYRMLVRLFSRFVALIALGGSSFFVRIIVYSPQLIENYRLRSGEGLSVAFVLIWLAGDLTNLVGAGLAHLLPTIIILAIYYCICDLGLLFQIYYYRYKNPAVISRHVSKPSEASPLLPSSPKPPGGQESRNRICLRIVPYVSSTLFVLSIGTVGYLISEGEARMNSSLTLSKHVTDSLEWRSQVAGWTSAFLYFVSRVPQIIKNMKSKCAGLSPLLFTFAMAGNATYIASILLMSTEPTYILINASWLFGSGITILLDIFVLAQFVYYKSADHDLLTSRDTACPSLEV